MYIYSKINSILYNFDACDSDNEHIAWICMVVNYGICKYITHAYHIDNYNDVVMEL